MAEESEAPQAVVGVRFKEAGRVFYFDASGFELELGQYVVVQTPQGSEVAKVVIAPDQVVASEIDEPLSSVLRIAEAADLEQTESLRGKIDEDLEMARKKVEDHDLPMLLVGGDCNLEGSRVTLYFTADERVDFRALVRDLSSTLKKRVQLLQIGDRDRAKLVGGIGQCGYRLCCRSWLTNFPSISIKMAKEQDVPLNPSKISGVCGRLLCCLAFEHAQYRELKGQLPKIGQMVSTPAGNAKLTAINVLKQTVSLRMVGSVAVVEMPIDELRSQYGTAVRPVDAERKAAEPRPETKAELAESVQTPAEEEPASERPKRRPHRRRRRGGRGGRKNAKPSPNRGPSSGQ